MRKKFCPCRSVDNDPRLSKEWHPSNPPPDQVGKSSKKKSLWLCLKGHPPYKAGCGQRCTFNSGCPVCGDENRRTTRHPVLSVGRPDLAQEWDYKRNCKLPSEVTLGSKHKAWWVCSNPEHPGWQSLVRNRAKYMEVAAQHARTEIGSSQGGLDLLTFSTLKT
jgi:hypothetical protein